MGRLALFPFLFLAALVVPSHQRSSHEAGVLEAVRLLPFVPPSF